MLQRRRGAAAVMMMLAVEMMMMIPMKSSSMTVLMATISPSGREFPRQFSSCRGAFRSLVFSASWRRRNISMAFLRVLGFRGGQVREGGTAEVGQGPQTTSRRGRGPHRAKG